MSEYVKYSEYEKEMQIARDLAIKDATPQELLENEHVLELLTRLRFNQSVLSKLELAAPKLSKIAIERTQASLNLFEVKE